MSTFSTSDIFVYYNGTKLYPTPLVNYSQEPINFGYVYGYSTSISLEGIATGITTTGQMIGALTGIFASQFQTLSVTSMENGSEIPLYTWPNVTINSISIAPSPYFQGSYLKYSIKAVSYGGIPSGVTEPSNEYSFTQNDDGTVSVNHKISARAVRNSNGAFQNAVSFVQLFTGQDPFGYCAPYFVPSGSGVLVSLSESVNRAEAIYSVNEVYKYRTGIAANYVAIKSLEMEDSLGAEFRSLSYNLKIFGSPIYKTADSIINNTLNSYNISSDISGEFGYDTSQWTKSSYSAVVDSGAATIDIKVGYLSGANTSGFFDYNILHDNDVVNTVEFWRVEGDFRCFGPLDYQLNRLAAFKSANSTNNWTNYLTGIIVNSPLYAALHNPNLSHSQNYIVTEQEVTGLANLKLSLNLVMGYEPTGITDMKYSINGMPNRWIYELLPSANIEGAFVVQNLQTKTAAMNQFTVSCKSYNTTAALAICSGYITGLAGTYISSGTNTNITAFAIDESFATGTYDVSYTQKWVGDTINVGSGLLSLTAVGTNNLAVPTRIPGYSFGY